MKIAQLGCFDRNIGDSLALWNPRIKLISLLGISSREWKSFNLIDFHKHGNNIMKCIDKFKFINQNYDVFLIGGAGLVEQWPWPRSGFGTGWKLPFDKETLDFIKIPIIVYGVGLNFYRGCHDMDKQAFESLQALIKQSAYFSVRSDGSYENLKELFTRYKGDNEVFSKVKEVPDAALIIEKRFQSPRISKIGTKVFNPSWSNKKQIQDSRKYKLVYDNKDMTDMLKEQFKLYPHTDKDFGRLNGMREHMRRKTFNNLVKTGKAYEYLKTYNTFDLMAGMHAHAQLISIGMNVPCISISTVDKMSDFCEKHDLLDFDVDPKNYPNDKEFFERFKYLNDSFCNDKDFLLSWYTKRDLLVDKFQTQYEEAMLEIKEIIS